MFLSGKWSENHDIVKRQNRLKNYESTALIVTQQAHNVALAVMLQRHQPQHNFDSTLVPSVWKSDVDTLVNSMYSGTSPKEFPL